jgi:murein DD-endopeptidase MepM/ murein hydrolase activator NlpD
MPPVPRALLPALIVLAASCGPAPASADAQASGGVQAPSAPLAGGSEYGVIAQSVATQRPVVQELSVPSSVTAGRPPRVALRIDEAGVHSVQVRVTVIDLSTRRPVIAVAMGWVPTGRTVTVSWPRRAALRPGSYQVTLAARDHVGGTLLRRAHSSGQASLRVKAPAKAPVRTPPAPVPAPAGAPEAGVPSPEQLAAAGAVFPVVAAHSFGGPENRFGAPRGPGRIHQGQDVLTAEGSTVVAPLAGTIITASYQAGGAGYYAAERTAVGFDFMFAHCQAGTLAVGTGQAVAAGQVLCKAGQTGSATAPHLHFEMWVGGWQAPTGHPIDPLPYLQAWDRQGAGS